MIKRESHINFTWIHERTQFQEVGKPENLILIHVEKHAQS